MWHPDFPEMKAVVVVATLRFPLKFSKSIHMSSVSHIGFCFHDRLLDRFVSVALEQVFVIRLRFDCYDYV